MPGTRRTDRVNMILKQIIHQMELKDMINEAVTWTTIKWQSKLILIMAVDL